MSSEQISPNFQRVRLAGGFHAFGEPGAGLHFRLLFGPKNAGWLLLDEDGLTDWPGGVKAWHRPPYSLRRLSVDLNWIDIDVVLHDGGRVTDWCRAVQSGTEIALTGPSGSKQPTANHLLLMGDETALPVILKMFEAAGTGTKGTAVIMVRDPLDIQSVETASDIEVTWQVGFDLKPLQDAVSRQTLPEGDRHVFFAGERAMASDMRAHFLGVGLPASDFKSASYWSRSS